jgi:glutamate-1-semialdehyde 2,1-aminomutase
MSWMHDLYAHDPLVVDTGNGGSFTDVDGATYLDFNLADMSLFCGFNPEPLTRAVAERVARGGQFLLPTEDGVWVAEALGRRFGLPKWQFTLSATTANVEAWRLARLATKRPIVLVFHGKYHGHAEEMLFAATPAGPVPSYQGLDPAAAHRVRSVPFNDRAALETALAPGDVACVVTEPAMTNCGVILPDPDFHAALRRLTQAHGTLLLLDETHTQVCGPGGLTRRWGLEPDLIVLGKSFAGGVPLGAYGMTDALATAFEHPDPDDADAEIASGGTLFANALAMAAARAVLGEILTEDAYVRTASLGTRLADGIETVAASAGLPWRAHRLYPRSGYADGGRLPRTFAEFIHTFRRDLTDLRRVYFANRGIWEAIYSAGPCVSIAHTGEDVDRYLNVLTDFVAELVA